MAVPPVGVLIVAAPLEPPKQATLVCEAGVTIILLTIAEIVATF